tara:strand:- start:18 stop:410 length:393 start_codon:yes stop_codon:yes gene_type:complete
MRHRKTRRFRHRSNGRGYHHRVNGSDQNQMRLSSFSNDRPRNNFKSPQSAEKLLERYNLLAKEALSSGDKILSEHYLQHADHFARIIEIKNSNQSQSQSKIAINEKSKITEEKSSDNQETNQNIVIPKKE